MLGFVFVCLFAAAAAEVSKGSLDMTAASNALWHSENAYCSPSTYLTRPNKAAALNGFVPVYHINDAAHDTEGYVGYTPSQSTIYVSYRGSESMDNWISNIDVILTDYPKCSGCEVHKGFYVAEQRVIAEIISQVKALKQQFPSYAVMVTGHSLGAALATFTAIDIQEAGIGPVRLYMFGCPRVGNSAFATWASNTLQDRARITHHKDMVVHSPMHERFTHLSGEWYEPDDSVEVTIMECSGYEDSNCSYQWHLTSVKDHLLYFGIPMGTGDGACNAIL